MAEKDCANPKELIDTIKDLIDKEISTELINKSYNRVKKLKTS